MARLTIDDAIGWWLVRGICYRASHEYPARAARGNARHLSERLPARSSLPSILTGFGHLFARLLHPPDTSSPTLKEVSAARLSGSRTAQLAGQVQADLVDVSWKANGRFALRQTSRPSNWSPTTRHRLSFLTRLPSAYSVAQTALLK